MSIEWNIKVRLLHWALALTVTFQQFTSLVMSDPGTQYLFPYHQYLGVGAATVLLLFWLYSYAAYDLVLLFPWGRAGRRAVLSEVRDVLRGHLPAEGHRLGLSSFIHGLGILAATGCAVTGLVMFAMIPPGHVGPPEDPIAFTRYTLTHKFFGELLWAYWIGHALMTVVHEAAGHRVLRDIFWQAARKHRAGR